MLDETAVECELPLVQRDLIISDATFLFVAAGDIDRRRFRDLEPPKYHEAIRSSIAAFMRNMERVNGMMSFLFYIVGQTSLHQHVIDLSQIEKIHPQKILDRFADEFNLPIRYAYQGRNNIDKMVAENPDGVKDGVRMLLDSHIISAWTAFESLVEDLWIQCLNARPRLAFIAINAEPLANDDDDVKDKKDKKKIEIPVRMLREPGFDIGKHLGDIIAKSEKWNFARRESAIDAYREVFCKLAPKIPEIIASKELFWLATLRNSLIHDAGIADERFERHMNSHPIFKTIKPNDPIPLNGVLVSEMVNLVVNKGTQLIEEMNNWLTKNSF
jgi:hypothetical protein